MQLWHSFPFQWKLHLPCWIFSEPTSLPRLHLACEMCHGGWWSITKHSLHHIGIEEPVNKFGVPLTCLVFFRWIGKFQRHPLTWFLLQYSLEDMRCFRSKRRVSTTFRRYLKVQTTCKHQNVLISSFERGHFWWHQPNQYHEFTIPLHQVWCFPQNGWHFMTPCLTHQQLRHLAAPCCTRSSISSASFEANCVERKRSRPSWQEMRAPSFWGWAAFHGAKLVGYLFFRFLRCPNELFPTLFQHVTPRQKV